MKHNPLLQPHPPLLLGLVGAAGVGKDTAATYLNAEYGLHPLGFADPVREMLGVLLNTLGIDGAWMCERALKEQPMPGLGLSYRQLAQTLGTEWGRALRPDLWVMCAAHTLQQLHMQGDGAVLTDVRFAEEAQLVRDRGGVLVRIDRLSAAPVRAHVSEQGIDAIRVDHVVTNDGSKVALYDQLDIVMSGVIGAATRGVA